CSHSPGKPNIQPRRVDPRAQLSKPEPYVRKYDGIKGTVVSKNARWAFQGEPHSEEETIGRLPKWRREALRICEKDAGRRGEAAVSFGSYYRANGLHSVRKLPGRRKLYRRRRNGRVQDKSLLANRWGIHRLPNNQYAQK